MDLQINPTYSAIYGELVLALYPILLKTIPTTLLTQTLARFGTFLVLALTLGPFKDFLSAWGSFDSSVKATTRGLLNLVHVTSSYLSYKDLPAGTAVSLFYTYPIMILLGRVLFYGEKVPTVAFLFLIIALIGAYLVANSHIKSDSDSSNKNKLRGIFSALLAAFTETIIYFLVRENPAKSPFFALNNLYPAGFATLLAYSFFNKKQVDTKSSTWLPLLAFNALLGFSGYMLRFFSIPKLQTIIFSMLSFIGVMAAYGWGMIFADEKPTKQGLIGGGLIATSIGLMRYFAI
jgi:drug/metabolite transporter (DMT)-like permease